MLLSTHLTQWPFFSCHLYILSTEKGESNSLEVHYNSECFNVYVISAHSVMMNVCITEHWSSYMYSYTRRLSIYPECGRILSFGGLVMRDDGEGRLRSWEIQFKAADVVKKATEGSQRATYKCKIQSCSLVLNRIAYVHIYAAFSVPYHSASMLNPIDLKSFALQCRNCPSVFKLSNFTWSLYLA